MDVEDACVGDAAALDAGHSALAARLSTATASPPAQAAACEQVGRTEVGESLGHRLELRHSLALSRLSGLLHLLEPPLLRPRGGRRHALVRLSLDLALPDHRLQRQRLPLLPSKQVVLVLVRRQLDDLAGQRPAEKPRTDRRDAPGDLAAVKRDLARLRVVVLPGEHAVDALEEEVCNPAAGIAFCALCHCYSPLV